MDSSIPTVDAVHPAHSTEENQNARPPPPVVIRSNPVGRMVIAMLAGIVGTLGPVGRNRLATFLAGLAWTLSIRRAVTEDNIRDAFPLESADGVKAIGQGAYKNMALAVLDAIADVRFSDAEMKRAMASADWKGLDVLLANNQPVLMASAHLGSWELMAEALGRRGSRMSVVVRPLSGALNERVVKNRIIAGAELILPRGAVAEMVNALRRGRAVLQLIDQALPSKKAVWVTFFGRPASATPAISLAAMASKAPVYVVLAIRTPEGLRTFVEGPVPVPTNVSDEEAIALHTQKLTSIIESYVRKFPEQWLWLHRRWKR